MLMSGIAKTMMMTKINGGNAVKMGNTNVYAILGSTKRGPVEFAKLGVVSNKNEEQLENVKNVVSMPANSYFQGYMTCEETGVNFQSIFKDFSVDRYNEIVEYLGIDKSQRIEEMSDVSVQKLKIAVTLSRNSKVYMLENPFSGMNATAREKLVNVIFSWAKAAETIAILCNMTDEITQMIAYSVEHEDDLPVISVSLNPALSRGYA